MTGFNIGTMISQENQVKQIPVDMLVPYHNHQYALYEGERKDDMIASIKEHGVMTPIICRPHPDENGTYEILIGHNRWNCSKAAGLEYVPGIIKENLSEEDAQTYVDESNLLQRGFGELKISEQARVISRRYFEMFSQGKRNDIIAELKALAGEETSAPSGQKSKSNSREQVGAEYGLSRNTVARLVRISKLIPDLQSWIDNKSISIRAAVELSYLNEDMQHYLHKLNTYDDNIVIKISEAQAKQLRQQLEGSEANQKEAREIIIQILKGKEKKSIGKSVKINSSIFEEYFSNKSKEEISEIIEKALRLYFNKQSEE